MKRKDDFAMQNVGGENILVPLGAQVIDLNGLVTLNDTAAYLWELLSENRTIEELVICLTDEFNIDKNTADKDVKKFLAEINKIGLLEK